MRSHCTPRAKDRTEGSTQRSVAVSVGMLAMKVINMVKKKDIMKNGINRQVVLHRPGIPMGSAL